MSQPEQAASLCACGRPKSSGQKQCKVCREFKMDFTTMTPAQKEWTERQVAKELEKRIGRKQP